MSHRTARNPVKIDRTVVSCHLLDNNRSQTIHWHFWNTFCRFGASDPPSQNDTLNQTILVAYSCFDHFLCLISGWWRGTKSLPSPWGKRSMRRVQIGTYLGFSGEPEGNRMGSGSPCICRTQQSNAIMF